MPANIYVSLSEYISIYGAAELIRLTNDRTSFSVGTAELKAYADGIEPSPAAGVLEIEEAFTEAEQIEAGMIDSYIEGVYNLPLSVIPRHLTSHAAALVRYRLWKTAPPVYVRQDRDDAERYLRQVNRNQVKLGLSSAGAATVIADKGDRVSDIDTEPSRIFTGGDSERNFFGA